MLLRQDYYKYRQAAPFWSAWNVVHVVAVVVVCVLSLPAVQANGTFLQSCLDDQQDHPLFLESLDGVMLLPPAKLDIPGDGSSVSINVGSSAFASDGSRVAIAYEADTTTIAIVDTLDPSNPTLVNNCQVPQKVHCLAFIGNQLYAVSGAFSSTDTISKVNEADCTLTDLATNTDIPATVSGSVSGPGGQCVGLDDRQELVFLDNDQPGIVRVQVSTGSLDYKSENVNSALGTTFGRLLADQKTGLVYWYGDEALIQINTDTLEQTDVTQSYLSLDANVPSFSSSELYMDSFSNPDYSQLVILSDFSDFIYSIPLTSPTSLIETPRPNQATRCDPFFPYEGLLIPASFPATAISTEPPSPTAAPVQGGGEPEGSPTNTDEPSEAKRSFLSYAVLYGAGTLLFLA